MLRYTIHHTPYTTISITSSSSYFLKMLPRITLGKTNLKVTKVCLGTMTWGVQNTEIEAHQQLDYGNNNYTM